MTALSIEEACQKAEIIQLLIPDEVQKETYEQYVKPNLTAGKSLVFSMALIYIMDKLYRLKMWMCLWWLLGTRTYGKKIIYPRIGIPGLVAIYQDASGECWDKA